MLHESRAKRRCGNTENDVVRCPAALKLGCCRLQLPASEPTRRETGLLLPRSVRWGGIAEWSKEERNRLHAPGRSLRTKRMVVGAATHDVRWRSLGFGGFGRHWKDVEAGLVRPGGLRMTCPRTSLGEAWSQAWVSPVTVWCSLNCASPVLEKASRLDCGDRSKRLAGVHPVLLRTSGSVWANNIAGENSATKHAKTDASFIVFIPDLLRLGAHHPLRFGAHPKTTVLSTKESALCESLPDATCTVE